jgi:hypothetical protein
MLSRANESLVIPRLISNVLINSIVVDCWSESESCSSPDYWRQMLVFDIGVRMNKMNKMNKMKHDSVIWDGDRYVLKFWLLSKSQNIYDRSEYRGRLGVSQIIDHETRAPSELIHFTVIEICSEFYSFKAIPSNVVPTLLNW